jgi:hypothetical protein
MPPNGVLDPAAHAGTHPPGRSESTFFTSPLWPTIAARLQTHVSLISERKRGWVRRLVSIMPEPATSVLILRGVSESLAVFTFGLRLVRH